MRIEVTIAKTSPLPAGAIDALAGELSRRIQYAFPDNEGHVSVRYAAANNLSVIGATKEDKQQIINGDLILTRRGSLYSRVAAVFSFFCWRVYRW